jgi:CBS domain-containing protein
MEDALGERPPPPVLEPDDTLIEAAAIMAQARTPLVPVVADGRVIGVVTAQRVLAAVLGP